MKFADLSLKYSKDHPDIAALEEKIRRLEQERDQARAEACEARLAAVPQSALSPEGDLGALELADVLDAEAIRALMEDFHKLTSIPMALLDVKGEVLVGVGWQDICTKFHRVHPETCKYCTESDTHLSAGVPPGKFRLYKCKNNMWDVSTPLFAGGKHVGNLFSGQFFFEGEPLDYELFRSQARRYGFDEEEYIAALEAVPRLSRETVETGMSFFMKFANILSQLSYGNIRLARSLAQRDALMASLRQNREDLNRAQAVARTGSWRLDIQRNKLLWSDETHRIFGVPKGTPLTYEVFLDAIHPEDREYVDRKWRAALGGEPYDIEHRIVVGTEIKWVRERAELDFDERGMLLRGFGTVQDITERKRAETELRGALAQVAEEKSKSEAIVAAIGEGLTVIDRNFQVIYQNQLLKDFFGERPDAHCYQIYAQRDEICPDCPVIACFTDGKIHTSEHWVNLSGKKVLIEQTASPIRDTEGKITAAVELARDITERKETENKILRISNLYEALSNTNKAIMYSRDLQVLFQDICRVAVEYGRFCLAGISMIEAETGIVRPIASSGRADRYLDSIVVSADLDREEGRGPSGIALREGRPYVCNDFMADPTTIPWRGAALAGGIRASAAFPLRRDGRPVGLLKVYSEKKYFFDENMIDLLMEMAENITFAIDNFSREERRRKAEEALRENEERLNLVLEGSNDGFWDWNIAADEVAFSRRFAEMLGYRADELKPAVAARRKLVHPDDWPRVEEALHEHLTGSTPAYEVEFRSLAKNGEWEWVIDRGRIVARGADETPLRMAGTTSIITERKRYEENLNYLSTHDTMTGLFNRAYFDAELARMERSRRYPVSVVIADVDGLKPVNDNLGHLEGDRLICLAARALRESFRAEDVVARIGGDEFAVLLPGADADAAEEAVRRVRTCQSAINEEENLAFTLSISIGSATAERSEELQEAFSLADSRMYEDKFRRKSQPH